MIFPASPSDGPGTAANSSSLSLSRHIPTITGGNSRHRLSNFGIGRVLVLF